MDILEAIHRVRDLADDNAGDLRELAPDAANDLEEVVRILDWLEKSVRRSQVTAAGLLVESEEPGSLDVGEAVDLLRDVAGLVPQGAEDDVERARRLAGGPSAVEALNVAMGPRWTVWAYSEEECKASFPVSSDCFAGTYWREVGFHDLEVPTWAFRMDHRKAGQLADRARYDALDEAPSWFFEVVRVPA